MEGSKQDRTSPFEEVLWSSPEEPFSNHLHTQRELISTPNVSAWPLLTMNLEDSESSSKTDSGYCSLTPHSVDSLGRMVDNKCHICSSDQYIQSTPNCPCQKNCSYENQSLNLEFKNIESRLSPAQHNSFLVKQKSSTLDLYDDAMDSSLYESEVEQPVPGYGQDCILDPMEIGEEKSIDFTDSGVCLPTTSGVNSLSKVLKQKQDSEEQENEIDSDEFFSPEANLPMSNVIGPKVRNETTPQKLKTRGSFCGVAKNICFMNRFLRSFNLNGIDEVDFLYQLGVKKNFPGIISKIFDLLSDRDLDSVRIVSKTWNQLFLSDIKTYNRWKLYKTMIKMKRENCFSPVKTRGSEGRLTLFNITNQNSPNKEDSPRHSPPVSPRSVRFHSYQKAAKNLKQGERLLSCPKCHFPSHDKGSPNVQCSRSGCQHRFCVWCRNETISKTQHNCPPLYTPLSRDCRSTPRVQRIGSKISKRNLRRL